MGGNALKHVGVQRKSAAEYHEISAEVIGILYRVFPTSMTSVIKSYTTKETYGDCDILIESDNLPNNWIEIIKNIFQPKDLINNNGVVSFDFREMQIDLIKTTTKDFNIAQIYFAFNDLGNLMGRIAHKMGFKYGHNGLFKVLREGTHVFAEIHITNNPSDIFSFMGYDYDRFLKGFDTLEDIFMFASSTPYFSRQIYQLDNRNHISKTRDAKRPTYTAFLKWIENKPELDRYKWSAYTHGLPSLDRDEERNYWMERGFSVFLNFKLECKRAYDNLTLQKAVKVLWNGDIVKQITGLSGKELGAFMTFCKESQAKISQSSFDTWIVKQTPSEIQSFISERLSTFK